jgi:hypothetical protein
LFTKSYSYINAPMRAWPASWYATSFILSSEKDAPFFSKPI